MPRWMVIPDFPNYVVSEEGVVENVVSGHVMALNMNQYDVVFVGLWDGGLQFKRSLPKLVATAFVPKPYPLYNTPINVDGDRWNNHAYNLLWRPRWFAVKYNRQFRSAYPNHIPYPIIDTNTGQISKDSLDCARTFGLLEADLVQAIENRTYVWPTYQVFQVLRH